MSTRPPVCDNCRGSRTNHQGGAGCWCRQCLKRPEEDRCQTYVPSKPPTKTVVTPVMRDRAEAVAALRDGTIKKQMFVLLQQRGADGYTDDEMETVMGRPHQTVSATRNALMQDGLVEDSGERRTTRFDVPAIVWVVPR